MRQSKQKNLRRLVRERGEPIRRNGRASFPRFDDDDSPTVAPLLGRS